MVIAAATAAVITTVVLRRREIAAAPAQDLPDHQHSVYDGGVRPPRAVPGR